MLLLKWTDVARMHKCGVILANGWQAHLKEGRWLGAPWQKLCELCCNVSQIAAAFGDLQQDTSALLQGKYRMSAWSRVCPLWPGRLEQPLQGATLLSCSTFVHKPCCVLLATHNWMKKSDG